MTSAPSASSTSRAAPLSVPISVITPSVMATSARYAGAPVPSTTMPPFNNKSCMGSLPDLGREIFVGHLAIGDANEPGLTRVAVLTDQCAGLVERPDDEHAIAVHVVEVGVIDGDAHRVQRASRIQHRHGALGDHRVIVDNETIAV